MDAGTGLLRTDAVPPVEPINGPHMRKKPAFQSAAEQPTEEGVQSVPCYAVFVYFYHELRDHDSTSRHGLRLGCRGLEIPLAPQALLDGLKA